LHFTRRVLLRSSASALVAPLLASFGTAASAVEDSEQIPWRHGLSLFGDLKYAQGFKNFDYVNPQAPKRGAARMIALGTFDNFNEVVAGVKGSLAAGGGLISDTLLVASLDEVSAEYGLIGVSPARNRAPP
jgi:microcin C transport system substrate-binding protein